MAENKGLKVGDKAPAFSLKNTEGKTIKLSDFKGKKLALYFYPKDMTPGCTKEACGFRDAQADYDKAKVAVLGVSPDPIAKVKKFADKFHLNFPLLADPDHAIADAYGVWGEKKFMGRKYKGVRRTTFVIAPDGKVGQVFENVKPQGHDQEVLNWVKENR